MTRNAVKKATALLAASFSLAMPAFAGDRAEFDAIGFSEDGRYFAFEEFGIQDGSGFPYSNIYVIDLPGDSWVKGTPVRVRFDSEDATVGEARNEAAAKAAPHIESLDIDAPATILALNGDGEVGAPPHELGFGPPGYGLSDLQAERQLTLEVFDLAPSEDCAIIDDATKGFALLLDGEEIARDTGTVPKSRGCPMDYRLYAVVAPADWSMVPTRYVAIISNYPFGFEGPDRRFLAVPLGN